MDESSSNKINFDEFYDCQRDSSMIHSIYFSNLLKSINLAIESPQIIQGHYSGNRMSNIDDSEVYEENELMKFIKENGQSSMIQIPPKLYQFLNNPTQKEYSFPDQKIYSSKSHSTCVNCVKWSKSYGRFLLTASMDGKIILWDPFGSGKKIATLNIHKNNAVIDCNWNFDSTQFLSGGYDKYVRLTDVMTGKVISSYKHEALIGCVKYHPVQNNVFVSCQDELNKDMLAWDIRMKEPINVFTNRQGRIQTFEFINNGEQIVTSNVVNRMKVIDKSLIVREFSTTEDISNQVYVGSASFNDIKAHPDGKYFLAQSNSDFIACFSTKYPFKMKKKKQFKLHHTQGYPIKFDISPDGNIIASGSNNGDVYLYNWLSGKLVLKFKNFHHPCIDISYHPMLPTVMATCSWNGEMSIWE